MLIWKFTNLTKVVTFRQQNITEMLCSLDLVEGYPGDGLERTPRVRSEEYYDIKTKQSFGAPCDMVITLKQFDQSDVFTKQMFFLETSGGPSSLQDKHAQ